jgi:hypothetical protein
MADDAQDAPEIGRYPCCGFASGYGRSNALSNPHLPQGYGAWSGVVGSPRGAGENAGFSLGGGILRVSRVSPAQTLKISVRKTLEASQI